ncbi:hypothetical protein [Lacrimispora celerecrescens]|uniref:Uncharacterized protein n=1 Tax=[Clostridium] celerecrescens 18A TaxID=1286362 RepID=A0A2M8Z9N8_9FIRM|nr:hypothetical protein [Lacrimispora celerecrescens]PJJ30153.1 hypothetical protein H171_3729 [[Clostridium] celerecrescens 18A]
MNDIKIEQAIEKDFAEYVWYYACIHNSIRISLQEYTQIQENNNHLVREILSNWDYNNCNEMKEIIKYLENEDSGLAKDKELLFDYKSKLIKLEKIQFILNSFFMSIEPINKSILKFYDSKRKEEKQIQEGNKEQRTLLTDILYDPELFQNNELSKDKTIFVPNVFPPVLYKKMLSLNLISKMPLEINENDLKIKRTTEWLRELIFAVDIEKNEEEIFYYWVIDCIFKISLVVHISKSFEALFDLLKKDSSLNDNIKSKMKNLLIQNEDYILKQLSKFTQSPSKRVNMYWINYEVTKLFQDLKNSLLSEASLGKDILDVTQPVFLNWGKEIDERIKFIDKVYKDKEAKTQIKIQFCTIELAYIILHQLDSIYMSIINSNINGYKIINRREVLININKLIEQIQNELNSAGISKNRQLVKAMEEFRYKVNHDIDFKQKEHNSTRKITKPFVDCINECYDILSKMYSIECVAGLKKIREMNEVDETDLLLNEIVKKYWGITPKNERELEKRTVKVFFYIFNHINSHNVLAFPIPVQLN